MSGAVIMGAADWPVGGGGQRFDHDGQGVLVPQGASVNVKGVFTELIASTAAQCHWLTMDADGGSGAILMDIAVGGAGSEVVVLPNVHLRAGEGMPHIVHVPLFIPSGARLSARMQSSDTFDVSCRLWMFAIPWGASFTRATDIGTDTGISAGTVVSTPSSANTKGSYAQLSSAIPHRFRWLLVNMSSNRSSTTEILMDIAVGGAGSESVLIANIPFITRGTVGSSRSVLLPVDIPAGARVSTRVQWSAAVASNIWVNAIGLG